MVRFDNEEKMLAAYRLHMGFREKIKEVIEQGGSIDDLLEQNEAEVHQNEMV